MGVRLTDLAATSGLKRATLHRILRVLDYLKKHVHKLEGRYAFKVDLTRQQIADLTGLRVETVIRAMKGLEKKGELLIKQRKAFR